MGAPPRRPSRSWDVLLGAAVVSGAFVEGHPSLLGDLLKLGAQTLAAIAIERNSAAR